MLAMEKDFDSKLSIDGNIQRSKSFAFRAPQENFTIQDFELGKIYGVGSYSKVTFFSHTVYLLLCLGFFLVDKIVPWNDTRLWGQGRRIQERFMLWKSWTKNSSRKKIKRLMSNWSALCWINWIILELSVSFSHFKILFLYVCTLLFYISNLFPIFSLVLFNFPVVWFRCEDMALESCEGGELFDQITRVSTKMVSIWLNNICFMFMTIG